MQKDKNFNDVAIAFIKGSDCKILFWFNLNEKSGWL